MGTVELLELALCQRSSPLQPWPNSLVSARHRHTHIYDGVKSQLAGPAGNIN